MVAFLLIALFLIPAPRQAQDVAKVYELRGQWIVEGAPPRVLAPGTALPGGAEIRPPGVASQDNYLVVIYGDGEPVRFECPGHCKSAIRLKTYTDLQRRGVWAERWQAIERLFWGNQKRYVAAITRGPSLPDAVLRQTADGVDVTPLLAGAAPGEFTLRFRPLSASASTVPNSTDVTTGPGRRALVKDLPRGLYEVSARANDGPVDDLGSAWVFVAPVAEYDTAVTSLADVRAALDAWGELLSRSTRRALLRASLETLVSR